MDNVNKTIEEIQSAINVYKKGKDDFSKGLTLGLRVAASILVKNEKEKKNV